MKRFLSVYCIFLLLSLSFSSIVAQSLQDAIRLSENEAYESAEKIFTQLNASNTTNADAFYFEGQNFLKQEKLKEAMASFEKGISINPSSALNYVGLGRVYWLKNDANKASENFTKAKTLIADKSVKKSDKTKVLCEIAENFIYSPKKDLAQAEAILMEAEKNDALNTEVYLLQGDVFLEKDPTNGTPAMAKYNKALEVNPKLAKAIIRQGKLYRRAGNPQLALDKYKEAEALDSTFAPAYREKAELYFLAGKKALAISNYEKYLQLNQNLSAKQRYAYFLYDSKQYAEALTMLKELQTNSNWKYLNRLLGYCLAETGDYTASIGALNQFLNTKTEDMPVIALDYKYLGNAHIKTGNDSLGIMYYQKAIELDTANNDLLSEIAGIYVKQKKYTELITVLNKKLSSSGDLSSTEFMNLGNAYMQTKDFTSADLTYAKVSEKSPSYANAYLARAKANAAMDTTNTTYAAKPHFENYLSKVDKADPKTKNSLVLTLMIY